MSWLVFLLVASAQANLPIIPYISSSGSLPLKLQELLEQNNLYGEYNGYAIPIQHFARGIVRFNISSWIDGNIFEQHMSPAQKKFQKEIKDSEDRPGDFDFLRNALKENADLQKQLFLNQVNQDLQSHVVPSDTRTRKERSLSSAKWKAIKDIAIFALDSIIDYFFGRSNQQEQRKRQEETSRLLNNHIFRTDVHLIATEMRATLAGNIGSIIKSIVHHNRLHESLYIADENSLQEAIENILGNYYSGSIFDVYQEKALHTVKATLLSIDLKRKFMEIELEVPVAFADEKKAVIRIVDLGRFHSDGVSFETDQLPSKWFYDGDNLDDWRAIIGNCFSFGGVSICESVSRMDQGCRLNLNNRHDCQKQKLKTDSEFTLVRRMTHGYVVATRQKTAIYHHIDDQKMIVLKNSVFSLNLPARDVFSVGSHELNGISTNRFSIKYGLNETILTPQTMHFKMVARDFERKFAEIAWIPILAGCLFLLFLLVLSNLFCLYRIHKRYAPLTQTFPSDVSSELTIEESLKE